MVIVSQNCSAGNLRFSLIPRHRATLTERTNILRRPYSFQLSWMANSIDNLVADSFYWNFHGLLKCSGAFFPLDMQCWVQGVTKGRWWRQRGWTELMRPTKVSLLDCLTVWAWPGKSCLFILVAALVEFTFDLVMRCLAFSIPWTISQYLKCRFAWRVTSAESCSGNFSLFQRHALLPQKWSILLTPNKGDFLMEN